MAEQGRGSAKESARDRYRDGDLSITETRGVTGAGSRSDLSDTFGELLQTMTGGMRRDYRYPREIEVSQSTRSALGAGDK